MIAIHWKSGEPEGTTDILPIWWFDREQTRASVSHHIEGRRGGLSVARCSLIVKGPIADLNYGGEHTEYNQKTGIMTGTMRLIFADDSRKSAIRVEWRDDGDIKFSVADATLGNYDPKFSELVEFDPNSTADGRLKIEMLIAVRQGQGAFRDALMLAYEGRCAITECDIPSLLEAAHISPYLGPDTNHVTNGLLLRADMHTLFDRGLITVAPDLTISATPEVISHYKELREQLRPPGDANAYPSKAALKKRQAENSKLKFEG